MSRFLFELNCKMCGRLAFSEYNRKIATQRIRCPYCGYDYYEYYLIDREHKKKTGEKLYKVTKNGKWINGFRERIGYGGTCIKWNSGPGYYRGIYEPVTKEVIERFSERLNNPEIDREKSYLLSFDPETKELTAVIGQIPVES